MSADELMDEPDFSKLKKKKGPKKDKEKKEAAEEATEAPPKPENGGEAEDDDEVAFQKSLEQKPRKKKAKGKDKEGEAEEGEAAGDSIYSYDFLLQRVFNILKASNPALTGARKRTLKPPNVVRDGSKKCAFTNFKEICNQMNRPQEHLLAFTQTELGTTGSLDGNDCLILRGRFTAKHIENLLRKYIAEYVQCSMCHTLDTALEKDSATRLYTVTCKACGAGRTVQAISSGFAATMKGDRKKARAAGK